ncbi:YdcF family protein [Dactylosporangium darangshiense]|uniref:YdcF family protein n=1 Tax=Dactylosporangium darangshiense TaxID=579108 RepID=A0ABP8CZ36_9ACTN
MSKTDVAGGPSSVRRRRRRRRVVMAVLAVVLAGVSVLTAHLFIWPDLPPLPQRADVIVQLGGPGNRRPVALDLARQGRAPLVAISVSDAEIDTSWCHKGRLDNVPVLCFHSDPFTTRGEARDIARMAEQHGWRSVILVTTPDQASRATLRLSRCFTGNIFVATARLPWYQWPTQIAYQYGATVKAHTVETTC